MKEIEIKNKTFTIDEARGTVNGVKSEKWFDKDMKRGIKVAYQKIILAAAIAIGHPILLKDYVSATAQCDKLDEFDEKTGIDVCSAKLDLKNHRKLARLYDRIHRTLIETATVVYDLCVEHENKAQAIEYDIRRTWRGEK